MRELINLGYLQVSGLYAYERATKYNGESNLKYIVDISYGNFQGITVTLYGRYKSHYVNHTVKTNVVKIKNIKSIIIRLEAMTLDLMLMQIKEEE